MSLNVTVQAYRGLAANLPTLADGQLGFTTDTKKLYVGSSGVNVLIGPVSGGTVKQVEIDFGALPVAEAKFTVADASVSPTSHITGCVAYEAPTGKDLDELEMDELDLKFGPGTGQLIIYARGREGYVADKFKINYVVG